MELIADVLLIAGALGAAFYCIVLSRRLSRFNDLETGVGGAIAVLSAQVDDMTRALNRAQGTAEGSADALEGLTERADGVAKRLELLVASMHDLPDVQTAAPTKPPTPEPTPRTEPALAPSPDLAAQAPEFAPLETLAFAHASRSGSRDTGPGDAANTTQFRSARGWAREAAE